MIILLFLLYKYFSKFNSLSLYNKKYLKNIFCNKAIEVKKRMIDKMEIIILYKINTNKAYSALFVLSSEDD